MVTQKRGLWSVFLTWWEISGYSGIWPVAAARSEWHGWLAGKLSRLLFSFDWDTEMYTTVVVFNRGHSNNLGRYHSHVSVLLWIGWTWVDHDDRFYLPTSPQTWSLLTAEEQTLAVSRLAADNTHHVTLGDIAESNRKQALQALTDWKVWLWMIMFFCGSVANTSISK